MLSPLEEVLNARKNNLNKSEKQNIETAQRNAIRLLKLVNTLLDFSSIERGRQQAMFRLVDIVVLTKNLAANFRSVIEKAGMKLIVKADASIQPVYVDKQMWEKIVFNLLSNAFKYTLKGKITVELSAEKDFAVLKVKDTGVGIPENEFPKMFERFHRMHNVAGRTYEGTGIGLSLIKELVLLHHGEISVDSILNKGSVFTVKIPFGKEHFSGYQIANTENDGDEITSDAYVVEIEALLESENKEALRTAAAKKNNALSTVLVVDDNADMREHISSLLSDDFNVITAHNGMDALQKMQKTTPDLVLADIMMPVMDGIGLLKEIRSKKSTINIPVIFLTARAGDESRVEGWETGADDYLVKPFSAKELRSRVKAQIKMVKLRQSLEGNMRNFFMEAPALICVLRGPEHVYELANEMYLQIIGNRDIVGKPVRKALPEVEGTGIFELLDSVYSTGESFIGNEVPVKFDKGNGKLEEVYFNFVYQPVRNGEGEIDGIFVHGVDVTEQVLARKQIEQNEKHQAFLLKLSDTLRPLGSPVDIEEAVTKIAMDFMDADRCYYNTLENGNAIVLRDAFRGDLTSLAGVYPLSNFALFKAVVDAGRPFIVDDVNTSDIVEEALKQICVQVQVISFINIPVIKNNKPLGVLSLVQSKPRKWTHAEVQLTIETAERTWAAVERAKAEEALRQSEEKYRMLLNSMDEGFSIIEMLFDDKGKAVDYIFREMNPAHEAMSGVPRSDIGKHIREVMPDIEDSVVERFGEVALTGEGIRYEQYIGSLDRWFDVYSSRVGGEGSRKVANIFTNITQRKRSEANLVFLAGINLDFAPLLTPQDVMHYVAEKLANFLHLSRCHFSIIDEEQDRLEVIYDYRADETLPNIMGVHRLSDILTEEGRRHYRAGKLLMMNSTADSPLVKAPVNRRKELGLGSLAGVPYFEAGKWRFTLTIARAEAYEWRSDEIELLQELTSRIFIRIERARVEEALHKSEERFRELSTMLEQKVQQRTTQLEEKNTSLQNTNKELEAFTYISSHDLQEPLRKIQTFAGLIMQHEQQHLSHTATNYFSRMRDAANRMQLLIQDLLAFSRINTSERKFVNIDLTKMINEVKEEFKEMLEQKHGSIVMRDMCEVNIIVFQFRQLFQNLFSNAIKFSKSGVPPRITVNCLMARGGDLSNKKLNPEKKYCHISVSDNGIGFEKQYSEKIFEVFQRLHARNEYSGTGIGLAIVKKIVDNHAGIITAESELGKGATFHIYLPVQ